jgi:acetyl-CoA carboxylase biotin carboxylase subunit
MQRALTECVITGMTTTLPFQLAVLSDPVFKEGAFDLSFLSQMIERQSAQRDGRG